jgi:hypothetical protein
VRSASAAVTVLAVALLPAAPAVAASEPGGVLEHAIGQSPAQVRAHWTPERMREAVPLGPPEEQRSGRTALGVRAQPPDQEITPALDTAYPERIHGKLFVTVGAVNATCSATVVTSFARNLLLTAAHCLVTPGGEGVRPTFASNVMFVPGYRDGATPFGTFVATSARTPALFAFESDPALDFGAVILAPGPAGRIQDLLGSRGVTFNRPLGRYRRQVFQIFGYPGEPAAFYDAERPILCNSGFQGLERFSRSLLAAPCHMQEGSSGGGWVIAGGLVNSVVSHGACFPITSACEVMAGPYFGHSAFKLWRSAAGAMPKGRKKRLKRCRRIKSKKKRLRCLNRAQTFGPVGA